MAKSLRAADGSLGAGFIDEIDLSLIEAKADEKIHLGAFDALHDAKAPDGGFALGHEAGLAWSADLFLIKSSQSAHRLGVRIAAEKIAPFPIFSIESRVARAEQSLSSNPGFM